MSDRYTKNFFRDVNSQSRVKLRVYESFLVPWSAKLLSTNKRIWVVDGFAGPGRYLSGDLGSPAIALERSRQVASAGKTMQCIFGDAKAEHRRSLRTLSAAYPEAGAILLPGDFWSSTDSVVSMIEDEPALVFVDPFGLLSVDFGELASLVARIPKLDLIVNFRSPAVARLVTDHEARVTAAVGSADWTVETITDVFCRNLAAAGRFLRPATLPIRERLGHSVRSELVIAARHPAAYELWNDRIVVEAERLAQLEAGTKPERHTDLDEVTRRIRGWASPQRRWRRQDIISWYAVDYCGESHTGTIKRAVDALLGEGAWRPESDETPIGRIWLTHS